jgi:DNA replication protein DnaC
MTQKEDLKTLAGKLGFRAIEANWSEYGNQPWLESLLKAEEQERDRRSLERRIKDAEIGKFKPMSEFDWSWPKKIDREQIEDLLTLKFLQSDEGLNVVFMSPNGLGKSMIAQNLVYNAVMSGRTARFIKASKMLNALLQCQNATSRESLMKKLCRVDLLAVDEVGYMSYDNRYADLLYEVISERYQKRTTIVTTNKEFAGWGEIFPNAACVVTLVDRLVHNAELVLIEGDSWRHHEAMERAKAKQKTRSTKGKKPAA